MIPETVQPVDKICMPNVCFFIASRIKMDYAHPMQSFVSIVETSGPFVGSFAEE